MNIEPIHHTSGGYIQVPDCDIVHNAVVYGFDDSVRAAKFPMSTDLSDLTVDLTDGIAKLAKAEPGSGHDQWLHGVIVQFDLTFSNKAWVEAERYHFFEFVSSQSTMRRIARFDLDCAYNEYTDRRIIEIVKEKDRTDNENIIQVQSHLGGRDYNRSTACVLFSTNLGFRCSRSSQRHTAGCVRGYRGQEQRQASLIR